MGFWLLKDCRNASYLAERNRSWAWGRVRVLGLGALGEDRRGMSLCRPGSLCSPSNFLPSSQNGDDTGTWPNNQFDTEMLQAMILASASGKWCQCVYGRVGDLGFWGASHSHHAHGLDVKPV